MQYRAFQKERDISQLGFGFMRLPLKGSDPAEIDAEKTEEMLLYAYEHGVNYFDTAYVYHGGRSEVVLGELLSKNNIRDKVNIADKLPAFDLNEEWDPYALFDEQLRRLGTLVIDFYLLHNLTRKKWDMLKQRHILEFLAHIRKSGHIGHIGFSFHDDTEAFRYILDDYDWEFCQIQLNFMDVAYQAGLAGLEYAGQKGVPVVIMEPLKGGQLLMMKDPYVDMLKVKHGLTDVPTAQICLNFLFDRPEVLTVLSGMNQLCQVEENVRTACVMTPKMQPANERAFLEELRIYIQGKDAIPCTACCYCVEGCPQGIEIPEVFELYNNARMFDSLKHNRNSYNKLHRNAETCIACGQCVGVCPQGLEIPELLKKCTKLLAK